MTPLSNADIQRFGLLIKTQEAEATSAPKGLSARARALWEARGDDTSKRDARFHLQLRKDGKTADEAWALLCSLPGGKAAGGRQDESYRTSTESWSDRQISEDRVLLNRARRMKVSEVFEPASLKALLRYKELKVGKWKALFSRLTNEKGVDKAELKAALKRVESASRADDAASFVRTARSEGESHGWWWKDKEGWTAYSFSQVTAGLRGRGLVPDAVAAELMTEPWTIINVPFGPEEPGGRIWNKDGARLAFTPKEGSCPTWDQLFRVVGRSLDAYVQPYGFKSGADYLRAWVGSVFQRPFTKLPWLFLWGGEDRGKSTLQEALKKLLAKGWADARVAVESEQQFSKELAGSVICIVEEATLKKTALERIKRWVTGVEINIHGKGKTPYTIPNSSHWIQCAQRITDCPFKSGDTRVTAIEVLGAQEGEIMSKEAMMTKLEEEAPAVLWQLLHLELPPVRGRMGVPTITTVEKAAQQEADRTPLESWCEKHPESLSMTDEKMVAEFMLTLEGKTLHEWSSSRILSEEDSGHRRWRNVSLAVGKLVPFKGTPSTLLEAIGTAGAGLTADALGANLHKLHGYRVTRGRAHGGRFVVIDREVEAKS